MNNNMVVINGNIYNQMRKIYSTNNKMKYYNGRIYEINGNIMVYNYNQGGVIEYVINGNGDNINVDNKYLYLGKNGNLYIYR